MIQNTYTSAKKFQDGSATRDLLNRPMTAGRIKPDAITLFQHSPAAHLSYRSYQALEQSHCEAQPKAPRAPTLTQAKVC